jgi:DNA-binding NtrC family response regulator
MVPSQNQASRTRVLIVDDDPTMVKYLSSYLSKHQFEVTASASGEEAMGIFRTYDPNLVLLDMAMPGMNGIATLERIKQIKPEVAVIIISAQNDPDTIFRASKLGADDYIAKPFEPKELEIRIAKVLDKQRLVTEVTRLREQVRRQSDFAMLFGTSPRMEEVKMTVEQVADTTATVLIRGESGTGKEVVARMIYSNSSRRDKPFVKVNCAAIPTELIESELFGHEKGSFTGAAGLRRGKFELADGGTLFLDEIGDLHAASQAKLLRVLQEGEFHRVGGEQSIRVTVRVISATNRELASLVAQEKFREDLYYRVSVVPIRVPALRERPHDIQLLAGYFLEDFCTRNNFKAKTIADDVYPVLESYAWPGNARELRNAIERMAILTTGERLTREAIPVEIRLPRDTAARSSVQEARASAERDYIVRALEEANWNVSGAARALGMERTNLHKRIRALGISREK